MAVAYDPRAPAIRADPYPVFRRLRDDDPVHKSEVLGGKVLTRYDDVEAAITDARLSALMVAEWWRRGWPALARRDHRWRRRLERAHRRNDTGAPRETL